MSYLSSLKLHNMRCYAQAGLGSLERGLLVFYGANGAGKTNILEAVSLLTPGRGLRGARNIDIQNTAANEAWAIAADVETRFGTAKIGTGIDPKTEKRLVRINGQDARGKSALGEYLACVWLTPQMDRLFLDSSGHRRRFLDRLIFAFDAGHSGRISRYENAMSQRSKLLKEGKRDPSWLGGLEAQMAETGVAIAAARLDFVERLQVAMGQSEEVIFPAAILKAKGTVEELLGSSPAVQVEDMFAYQLSESRGQDAVSGGAASGPHKTDLAVVYADKKMPAAQCSTGEQKALLIGIVIAHARLIAAERGAPPVLLLDEVAAHLDEGRRAALYDILQELGGQVWLTGTDKNLFDAVKGKAQFFEVSDAQVFLSRVDIA